MDIKQFQVIEKQQLAEQAKATCITNENPVNVFQMMSTRESKKHCTNTTSPNSHFTTHNHHPEGLATLMD
jgi:hypothetical protein